MKELDDLLFTPLWRNKRMQVREVSYLGKAIACERLYDRGPFRDLYMTMTLTRLVNPEERERLKATFKDVDFEVPPYAEDDTDFRHAVFDGEDQDEDCLRAYLMLSGLSPQI